MSNHAHFVVPRRRDRSRVRSAKRIAHLMDERVIHEKQGLCFLRLLSSSDRLTRSFSSILRRIYPFSLEESRFYDAVNSTFLGCSVRVK